MFRVKICGITNVEDAVAAVEAGADAIGLNFYEGSPRCVGRAEARRISDSAYGGVLSIGVFVNHRDEEVARLLQNANLDGVQFHGDEPPGLVAAWAHRLRSSGGDDLPPLVIRARRFDHGGSESIQADLNSCHAAGCAPGAVLIDASKPGEYGGTGETVPWPQLADHKRWIGNTQLILAGGLTPENVAEAIRIVQPYGVDVASGVESSPGKKDPAKVHDFVAAARAAFDALGERGA
jgi:phosphoribosylanthranilate isomerase